MKTHNPPVLPIPELEIPQIVPEILSENDEDHSEPEIPTKHVCKPTTKQCRDVLLCQISLALQNSQ